MKPALFRLPLEREAFDHGRTQEQLRITRQALREILNITNLRGPKRSMSAIGVRARLALEVSEPHPDPNYRGGHNSVL